MSPEPTERLFFPPFPPPSKKNPTNGTRSKVEIECGCRRVLGEGGREQENGEEEDGGGGERNSRKSFPSPPPSKKKEVEEKMSHKLSST